jgi:phospholipase C
MRPTRRDALKGIGVTIGAAAVGACGGDDPAGDDDDPLDSGTVDAATPDARIDMADARVDAAIDAPSPETMLAGIDTFVILMMENRSFDHYLGALQLVEGRTDVDGLTGNETNPAPGGATVPVHLLEDFTPADPPHGWDACHAQWNNGANDGFVTEHAGSSEADVMGYHVRTQIPVTYALADAGAICDRWFCSVMGPTWPNRFYLHGATSNGGTGNFPAFGFRSIFDALDDAGVTHRNYFHDVAWATGGYFKLSGNSGIEQFFTDAEAGDLPSVSIIDPGFFGGGANDDHPDHDIRLGQALIASVVNALGASPQWNKCLLIVTYDEHGGFYDHVSPPTTTDERDEFRQLGFRVPSLVVGPTARRGQVVSTQFEHVSVLTTLTKRFGLEPLNARVTATNDLTPCLDPAYLNDPQPAPVMPPVPMSKRAVMQRIAERAALGPPPGEHPELAAAIDAMNLPPSLDRRDRPAEVTARFLECAAKVGAVKLRD